jgi:hypothetical protein
MTSQNLNKFMNIVLALFFLVMAYSQMLSPGTGDVPLFIEKMNIAANQGIYTAFASQPAREYPPLASALLLLGKYISNSLHVEDFVGFKILIFLFYILSALILGFISQSTLVFLAFLMTMFLSSIIFGYLDILCAPFIYLGLYLISQEKLSFGLFFFTVSCLIKWQLLIFYPFVLLYAFSPIGFVQCFKLICHLRFWITLSPSIVLVLACQIYFGEAFLGSLLAGAAHGKIFLAPNGLNVPYLFGMIYRELTDLGNGLPSIRSSAIMIGGHPWIFLFFRSLFILSFIIAFLSALSIGSDRKRTLLIGVGAFWGYVALSTGVHENHIVMATLVSLFVAGQIASAWPLAVISAAMLNFNLALFYLGGTRFLTQSVDYPYTMGAFISVLAYLWVILFCLNSLRSAPRAKVANLFLGVNEAFIAFKNKCINSG